MPSVLERLAQSRRRVRGGEVLFACGDAFSALYVVHGGFFKTDALDAGGREQVTGFFMAGELLGLDGIDSDRYHVTATALEDSVVWVTPYSLLEQSSGEAAGLQHEINMALAREIAREQDLMLLLGAMRAQERLAAFLLNLSLRFGRLGYSPSDFYLRMTRGDIGSYLGLTLETVSRLLSKFQGEGLITIRKRHVRLIDIARLRALAAAPARTAAGT